MQKIIFTIVLFFIGIFPTFAGSGTDNYCVDGTGGINGSNFSVKTDSGLVSVGQVLMLDYGQRGISEGKTRLYYTVPIQGGKSNNEDLGIYQYDCGTHKAKEIQVIRYKNDSSYAGDIQIVTYSERYVVFAQTYTDWYYYTMNSMYIYDMDTQKMVVKMPKINKGYDPGYDLANSIYRSKKGTFILSLIGGHKTMVRPTSVIEINPKTSKITEL